MKETEPQKGEKETVIHSSRLFVFSQRVGLSLSKVINFRARATKAELLLFTQKHNNTAGKKKLDSSPQQLTFPRANVINSLAETHFGNKKKKDREGSTVVNGKAKKMRRFHMKEKKLPNMEHTSAVPNGLQGKQVKYKQ